MAQPAHPRPETREAGFSDAAWIEVLGAVDRTYADLVEYQERLEAQNAELQQMRGFLTSILASVSDVLIVVSRAGAVEQASRSIEGQCGRAPESLAGTPVDALFVPEDRAALHTALHEARRTGRPVVRELHLSGPDGAAPVELSVAPRRDDRGRAAGFVLTGRPLGELRQAYADLQGSHDALKAAQSQLVRTEKLASLGRLLAGVAHELNNPISFVYANAHALDRYAGKFEAYFQRLAAGASREELAALYADLRLEREIGNLRAAVEGAREGAERVRDIVADLRRLSADGTGERVAFDLAETARTAAHWVLKGQAARPALRFAGAERLPAFGRPGHVQQIIMNLVQNAADALDGREGGEIVLTLAAKGPRASLSVRDNGPGVPPAVAAQIFDPFFTTKPVGRGTGLGLSISHKIAEEHGGRLLLCPPDGAPGACFQLDLPAAPGAAP